MPPPSLGGSNMSTASPSEATTLIRVGDSSTAGSDRTTDTEYVELEPAEMEEAVTATCVVPTGNSISELLCPETSHASSTAAASVGASNTVVTVTYSSMKSTFRVYVKVPPTNLGESTPVEKVSPVSSGCCAIDATTDPKIAASYGTVVALKSMGAASVQPIEKPVRSSVTVIVSGYVAIVSTTVLAFAKPLMGSAESHG
mmetsp:Transcript_25071/g.65733  ORF Transcript_25071/g.65733 Transcript_25071/m.65733 type:complete len:200 (-) Transcript_25071:463-1062(-)